MSAGAPSPKKKPTTLKICTGFIQGKCTKGDKCKFSHSDKHLAKARKKFNASWKKGGKGGRKSAKRAKGGPKGRTAAATDGAEPEGGEEAAQDEVMPEFIEIEVNEKADDIPDTE